MTGVGGGSPIPEGGGFPGLARGGESRSEKEQREAGGSHNCQSRIEGINHGSIPQIAATVFG